MKNRLSPVVLVTTMWEDVDATEGDQSEQTLLRGYWKTMLSRGTASVRRFNGTRLSAFKTLGPLIENANKRNKALLEAEIVKMGDLSRRGAPNGAALYSQIHNLVTQQQEKLEKIRDEMQKEITDEKKMQLLMNEYQSISLKLKETTKRMEESDSYSVSDRARKEVFVILTWKWFRRCVIISAFISQAFSY